MLLIKKSYCIKIVLLTLVFLVGITLLQTASAKGLVAFDTALPAAPPKAPLPFDIIGFLESASLDRGNKAGTCGKTAADPRLEGGSAKINGITITIPCNTIVQMPATSMTWADMFDFNPARPSSITPQTGLALTDTDTLPLSALPPYYSILPTNEVHIQGNIVDGRYIAGLVFVSQQSLNSGQGTIEAIDYSRGELKIKSNKTGEFVRVRINDPVGRFGKVHAAAGTADVVVEDGYDPRFTADTDNPTVRAVTGFPMCIPRSNPFDATQGDDALCPESNRPRAPNCDDLPSMLAGRVGFPAFAVLPTGQYCRQFVMSPPSLITPNCSGPTCLPDPTRQAPFEVGDFVAFSGNLKTAVDADNQPYSYISAHTLEANLGIYTSPGFPPAYAAIESSLFGTNALPLANLPQETTSVVKIVGFTTDPSALVDIFMVDVDPVTGKVTDRQIGTENPGLPPVLGRFRFQPAAGSFGPFTRDIRVVSRTACRVPSKTCAEALPEYANGLKAGQYRAPNFDFIFPEPTRTGDPMVPSNFQDLFFLYCGSGPLGPLAFDNTPLSAPLVPALDPAPWAAPMTSPIFASTCANPNGVTLPKPSPIVTMSANQSVAGNINVTLSGTAKDPQGAALSSYRWTQISGTPVTLTASGTAAASTAKFKTPATIGVLVFELSVTNANGLTGIGRITVAVNPDSVTITKAVYDNRQGKGVLKVIATSSFPSTTPGLTLTVQASNGTYKLAAAAQTMSVISNVAPTVICPTANPCWQYSATGVIKGSAATGTSFLPPTSITVTSSMGGTSTVVGSAITIN